MQTAPDKDFHHFHMCKLQVIEYWGLTLDDRPGTDSAYRYTGQKRRKEKVVSRADDNLNAVMGDESNNNISARRLQYSTIVRSTHHIVVVRIQSLQQTCRAPAAPKYYKGLLALIEGLLGTGMFVLLGVVVEHASCGDDTKERHFADAW